MRCQGAGALLDGPAVRTGSGGHRAAAERVAAHQGTCRPVQRRDGPDAQRALLSRSDVGRPRTGLCRGGASRRREGRPVLARRGHHRPGRARGVLRRRPAWPRRIADGVPGRPRRRSERGPGGRACARRDARHQHRRIRAETGREVAADADHGHAQAGPPRAGRCRCRDGPLHRADRRQRQLPDLRPAGVRRRHLGGRLREADGTQRRRAAAVARHRRPVRTWVHVQIDQLQLGRHAPRGQPQRRLSLSQLP